ncbi:MAG: hypothetical protein NTV86_11675 [Planctomycetota bacterium]|nr:hypothetical protein [Planctomycetota bacterium]
MHKAIYLTVLLLLPPGCISPPAPSQGPRPYPTRNRALVAPSAAGWSLRPGPDAQTVLTNPAGRDFDVGETMYPDITSTHLLMLHVEELKADFLVLHVDPLASGGSTLTVFTILPGQVPVRAADIDHHWEWNDAENWRETLFVDSDGDGVPELRDGGAYRYRGTNTYYSFDGTRFGPLWIDDYQAPEGDDYHLKLLSRRKAP